MKVLVGIASAIVIVAGLRAGASLLIPLVFALFLALVSFPIVRFLKRRRVPAVLAVLLTVVAVLATLVGPGLVIAATVRQFASQVPAYEQRLRQMRAEAVAWLSARDIDTTPLAGYVDPARLLELMVTALSGVVTLITVGFLVVFVAALMMIEGVRLLEEGPVAVPRPSRQNLTRIISELQIYLRVKTAISLGTGLAAGAWVALLGVDFAVLWGLTAFLLNYIPNLGSIAATFPPALVALMQFGPSRAGLVVAGYVGINVLFSNVIEPHLMGRRLGFAPVVVFVAVIFWGWVWGLAGALLAVPMTMGLKIALEQSDDLGWIARLLEGVGRRRREPAE